jgi:hypothetical protein
MAATVIPSARCPPGGEQLRGQREQFPQLKVKLPRSLPNRIIAVDTVTVGKSKIGFWRSAG